MKYYVLFLSVVAFTGAFAACGNSCSTSNCNTCTTGTCSTTNCNSNCSSYCCSGSIGNNKHVENVSIINNTNQILNLTMPIPKHSRADIKIIKIDLQQALYKAILNDSSVEVIKAIQAGADINLVKDGKTPLLFSIICSKQNAAEKLLKLGAKPDDICGQYIIKTSNIKLLLLFVKQGFFNFDIKKVLEIIDTSYYFPFVTDLIMELISRGYDANKFWIPVLKLASCDSEAQKLVRFLFLHGANPNYIISNNGCGISMTVTPLQYAVLRCPNKQVVGILIEFGANINEKIKEFRTSSPVTLLSFAIEVSGRGSSSNLELKEVIEFLIEIGASL